MQVLLARSAVCVVFLASSACLSLAFAQGAPTDPVDPTADSQLRGQASAQAAGLRRLNLFQSASVHQRMDALHDEAASELRLSGAEPDTTSDARFYDDPLLRNAQMGSASQAINRVAEAPHMQPIVKSTAPAPMDSTYKVWTSGALLFGGGRGNMLPDAVKMNYAMSGLTAGVDMKILPDINAGIALHLADQTGDMRQTDGRAGTRMIGGSLYGSWRAGSGIHVDGSLGYGYLTLTSRRMDVLSAESLSADRSGHQFNGSLSLSYDFKYEAVRLAAYSRFDASYASLSSGSEIGTGALTYDGVSVNGQGMALGMRGDYALEQEWGVLVPFGRVELRHQFDGVLNQSLSYVETPATGYRLSTAGFDKDVVSGAVGLEARNGRDLSARMEYQVAGGASGLQGQGVRGSLKLGF